MYEVYKQFCERANIEGVYLYTDLNEQEIVEWEYAFNKLSIILN